MASLYACDRVDRHEPTLRESTDEEANGLRKELMERLSRAGVAVEEARITHLAYDWNPDCIDLDRAKVGYLATAVGKLLGQCSPIRV